MARAKAANTTFAEGVKPHAQAKTQQTRYVSLRPKRMLSYFLLGFDDGICSSTYTEVTHTNVFFPQHHLFCLAVLPMQHLLAVDGRTVEGLVAAGRRVGATVEGKPVAGRRVRMH